MSLLAEVGFESFIETDDGLEAYVVKGQIDNLAFQKVIDSLEGIEAVERDEIPDQNWNQKWESDYEPVAVDKKFLVRAPFHREDLSFEYDIVIRPRMSFGTGHHATTRLMLRAMATLRLKDKRVADAGSGTGVLAIAAEKCGAKEIVAYDTEDWAYENTLENVALNHSGVEVKEGDRRVLRGKLFDVVLANINKNVLKDDIPSFSESLGMDGYLVLSGFFVTDKDEMVGRAGEFGLELVWDGEEDSWCALILQKTSDD
jgi:ribosomal protein L11 methyltransferase